MPDVNISNRQALLHQFRSRSPAYRNAVISTHNLGSVKEGDFINDIRCKSGCNHPAASFYQEAGYTQSTQMRHKLVKIYQIVFNRRFYNLGAPFFYFRLFILRNRRAGYNECIRIRIKPQQFRSLWNSQAGIKNNPYRIPALLLHGAGQPGC